MNLATIQNSKLKWAGIILEINKNIIIVLLITFLLNSCSNRDYLLFEEYKVSFYNWNLKYSPTTQFLNLDSSFKNKKEFSGFDYVSDLKRFLIELNQIDINKVGKNNFLAYESIKRFLNKEIYLDKTMKFNQWNSLYYLNILCYSLFSLS